jgi:hypothetical protein
MRKAIFSEYGSEELCGQTANERIFRMKGLAVVEEAVGLGAKIYEGAISF